LKSSRERGALIIFDQDECMNIYNLDQAVPHQIKVEILQLARANALKMVQHSMPADSPIIGLAEAEVHALLCDTLFNIDSPPAIEVDGVVHRGVVGVLVAVDESSAEPVVAGFIQYKARLPLCGAASIGYAAVADDYRGQGLFRALVEMLKGLYPALGLDCTIDLVDLYEKLDFKVTGAQGAHVAMGNAGKLPGMSWGREPEFLAAASAVIAAKKEIADRLGEGAVFAYATVDADTKRARADVKAFVAAKLANDGQGGAN
jgi:GNAT superfamily N-acetyltransferase